MSMDLRSALEVVRRLRTSSDVVITSMGTAREWMAMGSLDPLDFVYVPSSMGEAAPLGLGVALAQPGRRVIVCAGDGSTLMNLGSLVTIASAAPKNLVVLIFDNGVYEVTGAQPVPGHAVDYAAIARASGISAVFAFDSMADWRDCAAAVIGAAGPVCAVLKVVPVPGAVGPKSPGPTAQRGPAFRRALQAGY